MTLLRRILSPTSPSQTLKKAVVSIVHPAAHPRPMRAPHPPRKCQSTKLAAAVNPVVSHLIHQTKRRRKRKKQRRMPRKTMKVQVQKKINKRKLFLKRRKTYLQEAATVRKRPMEKSLTALRRKKQTQIEKMAN